MVGFIRVGSDRLNISVPKDWLYSVMLKIFHGLFEFFGFRQLVWTEKAVNGKHCRFYSNKIHDIVQKIFKSGLLNVITVNVIR